LLWRTQGFGPEEYVTMARTTLLAALALAGAVVAVPGTASAQCDAPSLLLILDKSSSMITGEIPSGITKWESAATAVGTITTRFEESIDFGLLVFPNPDRCGVSGVAVDVGPSNADAIASYLATPPPTSGNYTPMAAALDVAAAYPPMSDATRRRVAVLVTDGWQWCYPYDPETRFDPVEHAAALRATGTTVFVVGFGDGVDALTLNTIAWDSGTAIPGCDPTGDTPTAENPCYQRAEDTVSLEAALDAIARRVSEEICDGIDNDCDGGTDEDLSRACSTVCGEGLETCTGAVWGGCTARVPAAFESCDGAADEDCDGVVDEGCACVDGDVRSCGVDVGACSAGTQFCDGGAWSDCDGAVGPTDEDCNRADDDCDGVTDEGCLCVDGDTRPCGIDAGVCAMGAQACIGGAWAECSGGVGPSPEACDGRDNDCDGTVDDDATCPPGLACREGVCVDENPIPDEPDPVLPTEEEAGTGCGCSVPRTSSVGGLFALFGLVGMAAFRRKR
jgi:MYXO-CTERM domain-containing protein